MLSEQSAATVRATLPVVGAAIGEITERFYAGLFEARPELLRDLFNRGNQAMRHPAPGPGRIDRRLRDAPGRTARR